MPKRMARWLLSDMKILELPSSSSHPTADVSCDFPSSSIDHPSLVFARRFSYRRPWKRLMHGDVRRSEANSFSNQRRSICSSAAVLCQRAQPAGLSIRLSESCFETRLILDGRSVSDSMAWHGPLKAGQINVAYVTTPRIYERAHGKPDALGHCGGRQPSGPGVLSNCEVLKLLTGLRVPIPLRIKAIDFQMGLGSGNKQI
ncbi:hypothetical protein ALC56_13240 [Trachymyrmex septentrionalis]|uniref:Uncharacterized protein n=1 Tax=Trachymyrmex septentrionalis TaxID=34720 RepID=A0A195EVW9_9HYME|nr:hypothetical protein ALC56_13240 [Trachymyrmex septentrionalis]